MSGRIARLEEDSGKDAGAGDSSGGGRCKVNKVEAWWKSTRPPPAQFLSSEALTELCTEVRQLVKDGKIAVHSVMSIWAGSPFGAAEAFKLQGNDNNNDENDVDEVETKFSCAVHDMIEILLNLKREDSCSFFAAGGQKDQALLALVPLATGVMQLQRKLRRITSTLESYSEQLGRAYFVLHRRCKESVPTKADEARSKHCYKFRQAFRHAWNSLSGHDRKSSQGHQSPHPTTDPPKPEAPQKFHEPMETHEVVHKGQLRVATSTGNTNATGCAHYQQQQQYHQSHQGQAYECLRRSRIVPSHLFQPAEPVEQTCQPNKCVSDCNANVERFPRAVIEQLDDDDDLKDDLKDESVNSTIVQGTSEPFDVSTDGACTSYLAAYEAKGVRMEAPFTDSQTGRNENNNQNEFEKKKSEEAEDRGNGNYHSSNDESRAEGNGNCPNSADSRGQVNGNYPNTDANKEPHPADDPISSKEVVVVRSAVSDFAESEFGVIDSEDMEWLNKIQAAGQSGQSSTICAADEIEQSERLKRQSIFMHCFRYRAEEALKDVRLVSDTIRSVETKWVDPATRSFELWPTEQPNNKQANIFSPMELGQLVQGVCAVVAHFQVKKKDPERISPRCTVKGGSEQVLATIRQAQADCSNCHRSFRRFCRMVTADTNFLRELCLGFQTAGSADAEAASSGLVAEMSGKDAEGAAVQNAAGSTDGRLQSGPRFSQIDFRVIFSQSLES